MDLDVYLDGRWHPAAAATPADVTRPFRREGIHLRYEADYAVEHLLAFDLRALSVRAPVDLGLRALPHWPSFLIDLLPQGAARKRLERLAGEGLAEWALLERGAVNPVGNIRVRPREQIVPRTHPGFELREMIERGDAFIDYASEAGATVAGATDTQGDAPKFWIVQDMSGRWHADSGLLGAVVRRHALLKFPVPEAGTRAADILRNEAAYQRVAAMLGLRVTSTLPEFIDGALLVPRFDRREANGKEVRLGVESLYSVAGVLDSSDTPLTHDAALVALSAWLTDIETELIEYLRRDLLNLALGNRDNHGRNTAILKDTDGTLRLAPLYDLGPSFLDARAITRVMRWNGEEPGGTDWNRVLTLLVERFEEIGVRITRWQGVAQAMLDFARQLDHLPDRMRACGVDDDIIERRHPEMLRLQRELQVVRTPKH
jgi:serine/threonine-protein kinase HipA